MPEHPHRRPLASFGRRRGRRLRAGRQGALENLLPQLRLVPEELENWRTGELEKLMVSLFPHSPSLHFSNSQLWLEIGFGGGEHLAHQAALYPDVGFIGCEPYIDGVATLLARIIPPPVGGRLGGGQLHSNGELLPPPQPFPYGGGSSPNIRIYNDDVRLLTEHLPDALLDKVFILYPDPWPKARHHKRRLVSTPFLNELARVMKPGAELRLATDDEDYCTWMLEHLLAHPAFAWTAKTCDDWLKPWNDWMSTRYEQKALKAGRVPTYLIFKKV